MNKRILVLLTVVALMVVMLATSVTPAFAAKDEFNCRQSDKFTTTVELTRPGEFPDRNGDGIFCVYQDNDNPLDLKIADNHPALPQPV
jgi:hypothetical protein